MRRSAISSSSFYNYIRHRSDTALNCYKPWTIVHLHHWVVSASAGKKPCLRSQPVSMMFLKSAAFTRKTCYSYSCFQVISGVPAGHPALPR